MGYVKDVINYRGHVEGKQEQLYFRHLQQLINYSSEFKRRVNFNFKTANGGSPLSIVNKVDIYSSTENIKVAIFDHDFKDRDFIKAVKACNKKDIISAFSIPSFNLFLIIHRECCYKQTTPSDNYEQDLKRVFKLDKDCDVKSEEVIRKILSQITLDDVKNALHNANIINQRSKENNKTIMKDIYEQPFLNVNYFIEKVFNDLNN